MLRSCLLVSTALALSLTAVVAADLPVKAPVYTGYPTGSGWYGGIGAEAVVSNASIAGTGLYDAGASILIAGGYQFRIGGNWAAIEASAAYQNVTGSTVCLAGSAACSITSNWSLSQGVIFGFPWTQAFAYLPALSALFGTNPNVPLPAGVVPTSSVPYAGVFLDEAQSNAVLAALTGVGTGNQWQLTPALALGMKNWLPNGVVADTRLKYEFANSSYNLSGPNGGVANRGSSLRASITFLY